MIKERDNVYENVYEEKGYRNCYDNVYILKGSLTEEQALKEIEKIRAYFNGTEIYEKENDQNGYLGLKKLAYSIGNETTGYYCLTHFRARAEKIQEIEMKLRLNDDVMKFITVRTDN